jgi:hypothetical protein
MPTAIRGEARVTRNRILMAALTSVADTIQRSAPRLLMRSKHTRMFFRSTSVIPYGLGSRKAIQQSYFVTMARVKFE